MLIHSARNARPSQNQESLGLFLLLCFIWLWPGIISHDLWRPFEPVYYAAVQSLAQGATLPQVYESPYLPHAPLGLYLSLFFQRLFAPHWMSAYTAVRLNTVLWMVLALLAAAGAGREWLGKGHGRSVVLLLMAAPGLMWFGHQMGDKPILFAATAWMLYGLALSGRRVIFAALMIGLGLSLTFWIGNGAAWLLMLLFFALLPLSHYWRQRRYFITLALALLIHMPLLLLFPYAFFLNQPEAWAHWQGHDLWAPFYVDGQWFVSLAFVDVFTTLLWYALPSWILAAAALRHTSVRHAPYTLPLLLWLLLSALFAASQPDWNNDYLLWMLIPLALLAVAGAQQLRRGMIAYLNWFGLILFGLAAAAVWLLFVAVNYGQPVVLAELAALQNPYFKPHWNYFPMGLALVLSLIWWLMLRRRPMRAYLAISNWAAGMTLLWVLLLSLFLPWIDSQKSHRQAVVDLQHFLQQQDYQDILHGEACMTATSISPYLAWQEYSDLKIHHPQAAPCPYQLTYTQLPATLSNDKASAGYAKLLWQSQPRPNRRVFRLYQTTNKH